MLYDLSDSLQRYKLKWDDRVRIFTRTYYNSAGGIDYFLYSIKETRPGYPSREMQDSMRTVFRHFAATYRLDSAIGRPIMQCGPMVLAPAE